MPHYLRWLRSHRVNTMMMTFGTAFTDWKTVSAKLEELCKQMNTNNFSLQTIVTALQNNVYVTGLHLL